MKIKFKTIVQIRILMAIILLLFATQSVIGQGYSGEIKYLRMNKLHTYFSEQGTEVEEGGFSIQHACFSWPAEYGLIQSTLRCRAMWLGCEDYMDPRIGTELPVKVVGVGPRPDADRLNQVMETDFKLVGRFEHPLVLVDDQVATVNTIYDQLDELDENLISERMMLVKNHTSIGVTVTKKVYQFTQQNVDNFLVYDYHLKNTGIIDAAGTIDQQTLKNFYIHFHQRYSFTGESVPAQNEGWGSWSSTWGQNTNHQIIGMDPSASDFQYRATYAWYQPDDTRPVSYEEDWGCPNQLDDGVMSGAKYLGWVTLHADKNSQDTSDDPYQPKTTQYIDADDGIVMPPFSQYDVLFMTSRWDVITAGHPEQTFADMLGDNYTRVAARSAGGESPAFGYGPYELAYGDSIRIVIAEGISGLSREKNREVGGNWLEYYKGTSAPELVMPDGSTSSDHNAYKRAWVETGIDSILETFKNATALMESDFSIPEPPPPPNQFVVKSGGDKITLSWTDNATSAANFDGYEIWRSEGNVMDPKSVYSKIFECDASSVVHEFEDKTAVRGFDYYYYVVSKDDGSTNDLYPGVSLKSSMFWTLTSLPAYLRRPAGIKIDQVRVVPNPFDLRARAWQFGDDFQYDRIAFYEIPPICNLKIFTERGDLIWEKEHNDGSGDELWDSLTSSRQIIVSGIYILYVEVTEDLFNDDTGEKLFTKGESVFRKFVVIR
ncbi:hypothetical protein ACFL4L_01690 [bacterium]